MLNKYRFNKVIVSLNEMEWDAKFFGTSGDLALVREARRLALEDIKAGGEPESVDDYLDAAREEFYEGGIII